MLNILSTTNLICVKIDSYRTKNVLRIDTYVLSSYHSWICPSICPCPWILSQFLRDHLSPYLPSWEKISWVNYQRIPVSHSYGIPIYLDFIQSNVNKRIWRKELKL